MRVHRAARLLGVDCPCRDKSHRALQPRFFLGLAIIPDKCRCHCSVGWVVKTCHVASGGGEAPARTIKAPPDRTCRGVWTGSTCFLPWFDWGGPPGAQPTVCAHCCDRDHRSSSPLTTGQEASPPTVKRKGNEDPDGSRSLAKW
jgi:hypothetical protein